MKILLLLVPAMLVGCAVPLTPGAEKVRLISAQQKDSCERIKLVTFNQRLGPDKPGNAMKSALNEAAASGADSFFIVSSSMDWAEGALIVGEALRCNR